MSIKKLNIEKNILELIKSTDGRNVYLGLILICSQNQIELENALSYLSPFIKVNSTEFEGKKYQYNIADLIIEYHYSNEYVPYMTGNSTLTKNVYKIQGNEKNILEAYAEFIGTNDDDSDQNILDCIKRNFDEMSEEIIKLLHN